MTHRRTLIQAGATFVASSFVPAWAQKRRDAADAVATKAPVQKLASKLRVVIPANAGGGWDTTGRMIGASLIACGATDEVEYENKGGKGGTIGLTHFVERFDADPNAVLVGGMVMLGAIAVNRSVIDIARVSPLAKLTSEFMVVLVATGSPIKTLASLANGLRTDPKSIAIFGGSSGGIDHMFAGIFIRTSGGDPRAMNYTPFASGKGDAAGALASGKAQVVISGHSEVRDLIKAGRVRVLAISSKKGMYGLPSLREQGVQTDMANWRGLFTGRSVLPARRTQWAQAVRAATGHESWSKAVAQHSLESTFVSGSTFESGVETEVVVARAMVHMLGLKA